jgi:hypothetical protein
VREAAVALTFIGLSACANLIASPLGPVATSESGKGNMDRLVSHLQPLIDASQRAARVYYQAVCWPNGPDTVIFPTITVQHAPKDATGVEAVRKMLPNDAVVEERSGIISIRIGKVPDTILDTKISVLNFSEGQQYNAPLAILAIEGTAEVQARARKLGVRAPGKILDMTVVRPGEGLAHLPASLSNVTVDQALDAVAQAFKGIVFFGACNEPALYSIDFAGGVYWEAPH